MSNLETNLTILIISWNCWTDLNKCLQSIDQSTYTDYSIIVIDNASKDGSVEKLAGHYPDVKVYSNPTNVGHTSAVNQGLSYINSQYTLLLDADTEFDKNMIASLMAFIESSSTAALIAPRTFNTDGSIQETARNFPSFINGIFGRQSVLTRIFPNNPFVTRYLAKQDASNKKPYKVEFVSSACMLFRNDLITRYGYWDTGYKGYWVDADWCMRLKKNDHDVYCLPEASIVHHEQNKSGKKKSPSRIMMFHSGAFRFYKKYYTFGTLDPRAIIAMLLLSMRAASLIVINYFLFAPPQTTVSSQKNSSIPEKQDNTIN